MKKIGLVMPEGMVCRSLLIVVPDIIRENFNSQSSLLLLILVILRFPQPIAISKFEAIN